MTLIKFGNGSSVIDSSISGNISVKKESAGGLIDVGDNVKIINSDINNNEEHTEQSYAIKIAASRNAFYNEIEAEISKVENGVVRLKLQKELEEIKKFPLTQKGQFQFKQALNRFKEFALSFSASVVATIAMKHVGY